MKVTGVETYKRWASWCNWLFVRVNTDKGLCGWGEVSLQGLAPRQRPPSTS